MWAVWTGNGEATQQARWSRCSNIHQSGYYAEAGYALYTFCHVSLIVRCLLGNVQVWYGAGQSLPLDCRFQRVQSGAGRWVARAWLSPLLCLVRPKLFPRRWIQLLDSFYGKAGLKSVERVCWAAVPLLQASFQHQLILENRKISKQFIYETFTEQFITQKNLNLLSRALIKISSGFRKVENIHLYQELNKYVLRKISSPKWKCYCCMRITGTNKF